MQLNAVLASPGFEQWLDGDPLDPAALLYGDKGKPRVSVVSIAHLGDERAYVLRLAPSEPDRRVDADADGHDEPARDRLHGRDRRISPAGGRAAVEGADDDAVEAGARVRHRRRPRDAEPGRPRLQGAVEHRHLVPRTSADRTRQGARARRSRRAPRRVRSIGMLPTRRCRRSASGCSCFTTSTPLVRLPFRRGGRCPICAGRSRRIKSKP